MSLQSAQTDDHLAKNVFVRQLCGQHGAADAYVAGFEQIAEEYAYDSDRKVGIGGELRDGLGLRPAEGEQGSVLGTEQDSSEPSGALSSKVTSAIRSNCTPVGPGSVRPPVTA